jgi:phage terminase large subunit-like protein
MRALATKAKGIPAAAATFKQKRLNLWVNATAPCLSMDGWRKGQSTWTAADMLHEPCFVGVDLASKLDLMALVFLFPPTAGRASWRILPYVWTPEETLLDRAHRDRAPYDVWVDQGWLLTTPGPVLDHSVIRDTIEMHRGDFDIERIGFDPWHADRLITDLINVDGWSPEQVLAVPQTFAGLSSAENRFQAEVMAGNIDAGGSPLLAWCASNVAAQTDGKDNIQFTKKKSRGRIDPIKAATTAQSLALRMPSAAPAGVSMEWV